MRETLPAVDVLVMTDSSRACVFPQADNDTLMAARLPAYAAGR
jgi:hypothetical protein